ncbi:SH3 domain-containing protein [Nonlabens dokdonensis]|nr:SH3 domain-containing protein [Nonlabens dokdonensis]
MKYIYYLFLFFSMVSIAQPETAHWNDQIPDAGKSYVTYGDNLSLREAPNTDSKKIAVLPIHTKVEVLEVDENTIKVFNRETPWIKVKVGNEEGYIASGYLALRSIELAEGSYLIYTRKQDAKNKYSQSVAFRYVTNKGYTELGDFVIGNNSFDVRLLGDKGLKGIDEVIQINYLGESCGEESGRSYLVWDQKNQTLQSLGTFSSIGDGGMYHMSEDLIFPVDAGGIENTIIYNGEEGESTGDGANDYVTVTRSKKITWVKGKTKLPIKSFDYKN